MRNFGSGSRYFIFKCQNPDCNEDIPVALHSFAPSGKRTSTVTCHKRDEGTDETDSINITCPYCNSLNHILMLNSHNEVNRHVFEAENKAMNAMQFKRIDLPAQV